MENVTVTNRVLSTRANGFKIGTETHADIANIAFTNSVVYGEGEVRPRSAVSIQSVDGARLSGVSVSNVSARRIAAPVAIRLGGRSRPASGEPGRVEHVVIQNVVAVDAPLAFPGHGHSGVHGGERHLERHTGIGARRRRSGTGAERNPGARLVRAPARRTSGADGGAG